MTTTKQDLGTYDWVICRFMDAMPDFEWYDLIEEITDQAWADSLGFGINEYQRGYNQIA